MADRIRLRSYALCGPGGPRWSLDECLDVNPYDQLTVELLFAQSQGEQPDADVARELSVEAVESDAFSAKAPTPQGDRRGQAG